MTRLNENETLKVVGASGQISLGKEHAGRTVLVEEREPGVWHIRTATVVPDNERWLLTPEAQELVQEAFAWAAAHPVGNLTRADSEAQLRALRTLAEDTP